MGIQRKFAAILLVLWGCASPLSRAQKIATQNAKASPATSSARPSTPTTARHAVPFTADDGLSVIAAALDSHVRTRRESDCSHLVHSIYEHAGFSFPYASSSDLYNGTDSFHRVRHPQPGDLVVWTGHVGIVVNPARRAFFSVLRDGPGIDEYDAEYWKQRGAARFYRYVKGASQHAAVSRMSSQPHPAAP